MDAHWNFDNSYARLPDTLFTLVDPTPVRDPRLVVLNAELAKSLGLDVGLLKSDEGVAAFAGNRIPTGATPLAQAYAGHQFGHFTMLGDGRAILLGEQITPDGTRFDIQLKGSGPTPYSRGGDGRAALGPMLREYIVSEAMHALNIPTTRSLAVVTTGEPVIRDGLLPGAILTRVAASHLRVGTFQFAAARGMTTTLRDLADYAIRRHDPGIDLADPHRFRHLLEAVIARQAALVAKWQLVGFIHGVMNTDNVTLSGETIDYGPCAFMDVYDPETVFSSIDRHGRYAYGNQPEIAGWNLARFAEALLPLLHDDENKAVELAQESISRYPDLFQHHWLTGMRAKLGLHNEEAADADLADALLTLMHAHRADYTNTFRALTLDRLSELPMAEAADWLEWLGRWRDRLERQPGPLEEAICLMRRTNPAVIARNHRVEEALAASVDGDHSVMERLVDILANPFAYSPEQDEYTTPDASGRPYRTFCGT